MADGGAGPFFNAPRICVDFGTALSKASVCIDPDMPLEHGVRTLALGTVSGAEHPLLTPSVLLVDNGRLYFGPMAFEHAERAVESKSDALLSFKSVLAAEDVASALAAKIGPTLDPTGTFKQRDALVLYLAYLDQLIRAALILSTPDFPFDPSYSPRRYTSPVWRSGSGIDVAFEAIFNEAAAVSARLGRLFLAPEGISIAQCKDALDKAAAAPGDGRLETGVFEPHAAAAASLAFAQQPTRFVFVLDMGAGTTDFAAFEFDDSGDLPMMDEVKEARQCSLLAGDALDRVLINLALRKTGASRDKAEAERFVRAARLNVRAAKEQVFASGKGVLGSSRLRTEIRAQDLAEDEGFKAFQSALRAIITQSLAPVLQRAHDKRARVVDVVLAGGGARLPFLPALVHQAGEGRLGSTSLRVSLLGPPNPDYAGIGGEAGGVFPQIAMSIGGAVVEMSR